MSSHGSLHSAAHIWATALVHASGSSSSSVGGSSITVGTSRRVSLEQRLLVAVAVALVLLVPGLAALDRVPVDQLDRRRHHADERRPLDRLEALAAPAGHVVLVAAELHR